MDSNLLAMASNPNKNHRTACSNHTLLLFYSTRGVLPFHLLEQKYPKNLHRPHLEETRFSIRPDQWVNMCQSVLRLGSWPLFGVQVSEDPPALAETGVGAPRENGEQDRRWSNPRSPGLGPPHGLLS